MRLRAQLLLVGTITLALPWAGWQLAREMEGFLRQAQARGLQATGRAAAELLTQTAGLRPLLARDGTAPGLYVRRLDFDILLDGYGADWEQWLPWAQRFTPAGGGDLRVSALFAENERALYALFRVRDDRIVYREPGIATAADSDRLTLTLSRAGRERRLVLATPSPGWIAARPAQPATDRGQPPARLVRGEWQETPEGYSIELRVPKALAGDRLGFVVTDVDASGRGSQAGTGALPGSPVAVPLVRTQDHVAEKLRGLTPERGRIWLVDRHRWALAETGSLAFGGGEIADTATVIESRWLRSLVYRYLLRAPLAENPARERAASRLDGPEIRAALEGKPATRWRTGHDARTVVASSAYPVRASADAGGQPPIIGAIVVEQASDGLLILANEAMGRMLAIAMTAVAVAVMALLGYASWLSWRIRRLRDAAETAVLPDGRIRADFPTTKAGDELGDLGRSFAQVLANLREHTDYLKTLASKLSHELHTPLAVVRSSLENLEQYPLPAEARDYADRAREGSERLSRILRAMSEAKRIEESIAAAEPEAFDLREVVAGCARAYRDVYGAERLGTGLPDTACHTVGSPELIAQALDKLIDNAAAFSAPDGAMWLNLRRSASELLLTVGNAGPLLPRTMHERLFDSMVSLRRNDVDEPHLGLGLYIVRLVAECHGGYVRARNRDQGNGVEVTLHLPRRRA